MIGNIENTHTKRESSASMNEMNRLIITTQRQRQEKQSLTNLFFDQCLEFQIVDEWWNLFEIEIKLSSDND